MASETILEIDSINVTPLALQYFRSLIQKEEISGMNLRMFVANPETLAAEVSITFCEPGEEKSSDERLCFEDFILFIERTSLAALNMAIIDYQENEMGEGQLSIKAPFLKGKGMPEGSLQEKIEYVIETEINPALAGHGGRVFLVNLLEDKIAVLQFGGGCHGCGMAHVTLKQGIEKSLKEKFPELIEIRDITDHTTGVDPYY